MSFLFVLYILRLLWIHAVSLTNGVLIGEVCRYHVRRKKPQRLSFLFSFSLSRKKFKVEEVGSLTN